MADSSYKVSAEVSTANSVTNLRALSQAVDQTAASLKALNTVTKEGEADLASMTRSVAALLASYRQAAQAEKEMAQAKLATAKATATQQAAEDKHAATVALTAARETQAAKNQAQADRTAAGTANDRLRTENQLANGFVQREAAQNRVTLAQQKYADTQERAKKNELELADNLSNTRYLLYDVGATYRALSIGLEAIPVATAAVATAYQRDFAQVQRVTEGTQQENDQLRESLKGIAEDLPVGFGELTQIAQLGAQMGIPTQALSDFTDVTAKFVAVTGVAADTASSLFGRLDTAFNADNSVPDFFNKVGASIAKVGAETVATDPEIASMLNQISSIGASAGFTASQTIGLAAALASVRVQPELARGTLTRVFAQLDRDVSSGGKGLDAYAKLLGVTQQQAANLWKTNPSQFFQQMIGGLNQIYKANGDLTGTFDALGIKAVRDVSSLTKLAVGYDVLGKSMQSANDAFNSGTALDDMSKPVFETVAAKLQVLANSFQNLADTLGRGALAPLGAFIDILTDLVQGLDSLAKTNPVVLTILNTLLGFGAVAGIFLGIKAANAFVLAGIVSFQQLLGSSAGKAATFSGIIKQLAVSQLMAKGATEAQAAALLKQAGAFEAVAIASKLSPNNIALIPEGEVMTVTKLGDEAWKAGQKFGGFKAGAKGAFDAVTSLVGGLPGLITMLGVGLVGALLSAQSASDGVAKSLGEALNGSTSDAAKAAGEAIKNLKVGLDASGGEGFNFGDYGKGLDQIASRAGISIDQMVSALTKGKQGLADFKKYLDQYAKDNGFSGGLNDFALQNSGPGTKGADIYFVAQAMDRLSQKSQDAAASNKTVDAAVTKAGGSAADAATKYDDLSGGMDGTTTAADKLDKALKAINDTIFGSLDAQSALGDSLSKLGEGLQKGGSFNNSEVGRTNLKNLEDTLAAAQKLYALQAQSGDKAGAAAGYADFVNQLLGKVQALGGNVGPIQDLARQTVKQFNAAIGADTAANPATVQVVTKVDTVQPVQQAKSVGEQVSSVIAAQTPTLNITANGDQASQEVYTLALSISKLTGMPLEVVIDALTNPASDKAKQVQDYINQIVKDPKKFSINADTTAAVANVQNFASYAARQLAAVQSYVNSVAATAPVLSQFIVPGVKPNLTGTPYKPGLGGGSLPTMQTVNAPAQVQATQQATGANNALAGALDQVGAGYNKAQLAADKAGSSGKKAGKDSADAWKDAGNAIDEATSNADEYASRLKQGLDRAFEKQYGVQIATDAYYQKLNDIKKAREDELKQVDDLREKIKQANDEMNKDLIDANKAKIEQKISMKYGEVDRAADYGNQAQTALDNAAAKKKEIETDQQQADQIQSGIGLLTGYSDAAIKNRADIRSLEQAQLSMVEAYAKTGASIDQVRAYAQKLNAQFQNDVVQVGFNQGAVQNLTGDLGRYIDVINRVPYLKPTTVTANTDQATDALNNLGNDYNNLDNQLANNPLEVNARVNWDWNVQQLKGTEAGSGVWSAISNQGGVDMAAGYVKANWEGGVAEGYAAGGSIVPGTAPANPRQDNVLGLVDGKRPVGLRSGEGIVNVPAMDYYGGEQFLDALNKRKLPRYALGGVVGGGSGSSGGTQVVELTAEQLSFLAQHMGAEVKLMVDAKEIARASNKGNREIASEGGRRG